MADGKVVLVTTEPLGGGSISQSPNDYFWRKARARQISAVQNKTTNSIYGVGEAVSIALSNAQLPRSPTLLLAAILDPQTTMRSYRRYPRSFGIVCAEN
jgi:hypothetical protein